MNSFCMINKVLVLLKKVFPCTMAKKMRNLVPTSSRMLTILLERTNENYVGSLFKLLKFLFLFLSLLKHLIVQGRRPHFSILSLSTPWKNASRMRVTSRFFTRKKRERSMHSR